MSAMTLIEHVEVDPARSTISFNPIPTDGTYTDLWLVCSLRNTTNANYFTLKFNNSTSDFTQKQLDGAGGVSSSSNRTDSIMRFAANSSDFTANTPASANIYIPNFASSNYKNFSVEAVTENNSSSQYFMGLLACLWSQTSSISSIDLVSPSNFAQYSSATLYGIKAGSDGIVTVS